MRRFHSLAPLWVALLALLISAIVALARPLPEPRFHDEFSYLLAGDTLARGRLTNRPHPMWEFFETFQVLQQPTYASKYPPGQGLVLAFGKLVGGHPIVGVWVSTALACAALWWGLAAFVPKRWATLGAIVAATHPLMLQWNWGYWGGAVATCGGALAVGGAVRLRRRPRVTSALATSVGLFVLLISRPFEGTVLCALGFFLIRATPRRRGGRLRPLAAGAVALAIGLGWIGYYNWRVTGGALRLPYAVYESTYAACPPFIWWPRSGDVPRYRHATMRDYYVGWELREYERQRTPAGLVEVMRKKLVEFVVHYFNSPLLAVPVLAVAVGAARSRSRTTRRALLVAVAFTLVVFGNLWFFPHYAAPAAVVYLLVVVRGVRLLRARFGGRWTVWAGVVVAAQLVAAATWVARYERVEWAALRAGFVEQARREGRRVLVIVRPGEGYYAHNEWVYNDADVDASPVVWARDMGEARNRRLLEYFADRDTFVLDVDANQVRFTPVGR